VESRGNSFLNGNGSGRLAGEFIKRETGSDGRRRPLIHPFVAQSEQRRISEMGREVDGVDLIVKKKSGPREAASENEETILSVELLLWSGGRGGAGTLLALLAALVGLAGLGALFPGRGRLGGWGLFIGAAGGILGESQAASQQHCEYDCQKLLHAKSPFVKGKSRVIYSNPVSKKKFLWAGR
jgi:hypothetical protein